MERIRIVIICILLSACSKGDSKVNEDSLLAKEISNTARYYETKQAPEVREFIEKNHQNSECANDLLREVFKLYMYLDSVQISLEERSGGYDVNGRLIAADSQKIAARLLADLKFSISLEEAIGKMKKISGRENILAGDLIMEKIDNDIKLFSFDTYAIENVDSIAVVQFYNDLLLVKSSLLFTEMMYFELLKSNSECGK